MHPIVFLPLFVVVMIVISNCAASKGSIVILENPNAAGFTADFKAWSAENKCALSLRGGDVLQLDVIHEDGEIALTIGGKNGSLPYTGSKLRSGMFTVTVSETDEYVFHFRGKAATGKLTVRNLGPGEE